MHAPDASVRKHARGFLTGAAAAVVTAVTACSSDSSTSFTGTPAVLIAAAGDNTIGSVAADIGPFVVKVTDTAGTAIPNVTVTFSASAGLTLVTASATTGAEGTAFTAGTFGTVAGAYTVTATVSGISTPLVFHTIAAPDVASAFVIAGGNNQSAPAATQMGELLAVSVKDKYGNPINNITVTWTSPRGVIGTPAGHTGANGVASTTFTLPATAGSTIVSATAIINSIATTLNFNETGT